MKGFEAINLVSAWPWNVGRAESKLTHRTDGVVNRHLNGSRSQSYLFGSAAEDCLLKALRLHKMRLKSFKGYERLKGHKALRP